MYYSACNLQSTLSFLWWRALHRCKVNWDFMVRQGGKFREKFRAKHAAGCGCLTNCEDRLRDGACSLLAHDRVHTLHPLSPLPLSWASVPIKKCEDKLSYPLQPLLTPDIKSYFTIKTYKHLIRLWNTNPSSKMLKIYLHSFWIAWSQKVDLKAFEIPFKLQFHSGSLLLPPRQNTNKITLEGLRL